MPIKLIHKLIELSPYDEKTYLLKIYSPSIFNGFNGSLLLRFSSKNMTNASFSLKTRHLTIRHFVALHCAYHLGCILKNRNSFSEVRTHSVRGLIPPILLGLFSYKEPHLNTQGNSLDRVVPK